MGPPDQPDAADDLSAAPSQDTFLDRLARPVRRPPALAAGACLGEKYVIQKMIGAGGMGEVYLARDQSLGREVALKRHHDGRDLDRLRREAQVMAKLAHPNVVAVYEVGAFEEGLFVVMEHVPGTTLRGHLAVRTHPPARVIELLCMAGEGLAAAHAAGIVHRDFKPENVLIGRDGRARVSDFGLARDGAALSASAAFDETASTWSVGSGEVAFAPTLPRAARGTPGAATLPGTVMGTPGYMAPEQASGELVDARADQYAFCVVAWEALFGARPVGRARRWPALGRARHLRRVLARGLSADRTARYPDMAALLADLRSYRAWRAPVLAAAALAGAAALLWWRPWVVPPSCDDAGGWLDDGGALARLISAAERAAPPHPAGERARTWRDDAREAARAGCRARRAGAWSSELFARAEACEREARVVLRALLGGARAAAAKAELDELGLRLLRLPAAKACAEPALLLGVPAPPRDARAAATAAATRGAIAAAELLGSPLTVDERGPPSVAGRVALWRAAAVGAPAGRAAALEAARDRALADGDAATALAASAARLRHAFDVVRDRAAVARWLALATADATALAAAAPAAAVQLYLAAADAELALADLTPAPRGASTRTEEQALAWVAKAIAIAPASSPSLVSIEALLRRGALQLAMGRFVDGKADLAAAHRLAGILGGADSLLAGRVAAQAGLAHLRGGQPEDAAPYLREALAISAAAAYDARRAPLLAGQARALRRALGMSSLESGDSARGIAVLAPLRAEADVVGDRASYELAVALGLAYVEQRRPSEASALLGAELAAQRASLGGDHPELALLYYNLAAAQRDAELLDDAAETVARAEAIWRAAGDEDRVRYAVSLRAYLAVRRGRPDEALALTAPLVEGTQRVGDAAALARPYVEHARALIALRQHPERARYMLRVARQIYELQAQALELAKLDELERALPGGDPH